MLVRCCVLLAVAALACSQDAGSAKPAAHPTESRVPGAAPPTESRVPGAAPPTESRAPAGGAKPAGVANVSDATIDQALSDRRFIQRQIKCALGEAPCDPVGRRLKTLAPLVLRGSCPQCTPQETQQIQRTLSHVQRNYPREWSRIVRQYAG